MTWRFRWASPLSSLRHLGDTSAPVAEKYYIKTTEPAK